MIIGTVTTAETRKLTVHRRTERPTKNRSSDICRSSGRTFAMVLTLHRRNPWNRKCLTRMRDHADSGIELVCSCNHCLTRMATEADINDSARLVNQRTLTITLAVVGWTRLGEVYAGEAEIICPPLIVKLANWCEIWARMSDVSFVESSCNNEKARTLKAVKTAEKRPA